MQTVNTLTRNEGYKRAAGKEQIASAIFLDWAKHYNFDIEEIKGYESNRTIGDYYLNGKPVECKSQPIGKYNQNFIELGEITANPIHSNGWQSLKDMLITNGTSITHMEEYTYFNYALTPATNGAHMIYINRDTQLIYVYSSQRFIKEVATAVKEKGIQRGLGKSHKDTLSCFIPNATAVFQKINGEWTYKGTTDEQTVLNFLRG